MIYYCTTAPRLQTPVEKTFLSLRRARINDPVHCFAEPATYRPTDNNLIWHQNESKLGCYGNFMSATKFMYDNHPSNYYVYMQDDSLISGKIKPKIEEVISLGYDCVWMYLSNHHYNTHFKGYKNGFHKHTENCYWGIIFNVFSKRAIEAILNSPFLSVYEGIGMNTDCLVSSTMNTLNIPQYFSIPSLVEHKGKNSTVNHRSGWNNKGYRFS